MLFSCLRSSLQSGNVQLISLNESPDNENASMAAFRVSCSAALSDWASTRISGAKEASCVLKICASLVRWLVGKTPPLEYFSLGERGGRGV